MARHSAPSRVWSSCARVDEIAVLCVQRQLGDMTVSQTMAVDRDNTRTSASRAPVNYIIDRSAELLTASTLYVMGLRNPAIYWNGRRLRARALSTLTAAGTRRCCRTADTHTSTATASSRLRS